jgi:hypothetical protein
MKWMEIIRLRVAPDQMTRVGPQLEVMLDGLSEVLGLEKATAYVGVSSPGDMGLLLLWDTEGVPPVFGSPMTQSLMPACRRFGLVDHSVWIEAEGNGRGARSEGASPTGPALKPVSQTNAKGDRR